MRRVALLAALFLSPLAWAQSEPTAQQLNSQGMDLYKQKDWAGAKAKFEEAIQKDPKHVLAHYNLACTLARARAEGPANVCSLEAYREAITSELSKAIALDPKRADRAKKDSDLANVRDTVAYQMQVMGLSEKDPTQLATIVERVSWWGNSNGAYGSRLQLDFQPKGKVVVKEMQLRADGQPKWTSFSGTWSVEGTTVKLNLPKELFGSKTPAATFVNGELHFGEGVSDVVQDSPSECEA